MAMLIPSLAFAQGQSFFMPKQENFTCVKKGGKGECKQEVIVEFDLAAVKQQIKQLEANKAQLQASIAQTDELLQKYKTLETSLTQK